ncbi:MAG TPA: type II toxin-antitoxin system RelE/ParE family toxin [Flavobacteriales bacterium]|jgi:plasmid stabilization system protein ParE|nr:type II toxin-antitoxin system RelE/ParE family toxin [Flavobacteriales bacterium]MBK7101235.1 type II toxin-antitoxin system RelE/ParE family toxin [Flavobacteriales bacterium]MBK7111944.1 type II toxin-antitoxin system RelE/ParE family toxin [Flavobacteriales bacterium]MBK7482054.1 type II toxin-antitoxin system RelE/ParE family toxin [Flavobacteriales bacterium]MBK7619027.1 type II toxin-antitoxin system RelE/ParE family toxin [Flavobacteriales bacterium]
MAQRAVRWSLRSIQDKLEIYTYWTEHNGSTRYAEKLDRLFNEIMELACIFPNSGVPTELDDIRFHTVRNFKLVYRVTPATIDVVTIWDNDRDPESLRIQ